MDDINQDQWVCITNLIDKIGDQADKLQWEELSEQVADVFDSINNETSAQEKFFGPYQFLFRLHLRVKHYDRPEEFNQIYDSSKLINHEYMPFFSIRNYDYKMFLWARKKGFVEYISNDIIDIPKDKLTPSQIKNFESKLKK